MVEYGRLNLPKEGNYYLGKEAWVVDNCRAIHYTESCLSQHLFELFYRISFADEKGGQSKEYPQTEKWFSEVAFIVHSNDENTTGLENPT